MCCCQPVPFAWVEGWCTGDVRCGPETVRSEVDGGPVGWGVRGVYGRPRVKPHVALQVCIAHVHTCVCMHGIIPHVPVFSLAAVTSHANHACTVGLCCLAAVRMRLKRMQLRFRPLRVPPNQLCLEIGRKRGCPGTGWCSAPRDSAPRGLDDVRSLDGWHFKPRSTCRHTACLSQPSAGDHCQVSRQKHMPQFVMP